MALARLLQDFVVIFWLWLCPQLCSHLPLLTFLLEELRKWYYGLGPETLNCRFFMLYCDSHVPVYKVFLTLSLALLKIGSCYTLLDSGGFSVKEAKVWVTFKSVERCCCSGSSTC